MENIKGETTSGTPFSAEVQVGAGRYKVSVKGATFFARYSGGELSGQAAVSGKTRNIRLPLDEVTHEAVKAAEAEMAAHKARADYEDFGKYFEQAAATGERVLMHKEFGEDMRYRRAYAMPDGSTQTTTVNAH